MNNMNDPNNKVTTPVDGGTSPATTKMFFALGNVNNNINNNINNNNNGNNNNNNNNGYRLLSAQGMETLQAENLLEREEEISELKAERNNTRTEGSIRKKFNFRRRISINQRRAKKKR
ncbi:unnamed protein product [Callosobruchus maculatus]|uniref:Uncharacterized protein n=1 Tax=Callosobruchus maculatus TaxID=64391 RepID=A0A653D5T1_CALMS|nr:unnamed protein product [Callosobruchus maculatus]